GSTVADPAYAQKCKQLIQASSVLSRRIDLTGSLTFDEVCTAYQGANLFLSASSMETYGMAIQEAAASGLPLLLQAGGYSEQHLHSTGKGTLVSNMKALVEQINEWEKKPQTWLALQAEAWEQRPRYPTWRETAQDLLRQLVHFLS
ncbi:MAG: glycosyltransferase, partial [Bacteroidota bacterium]